MPATVTIISPCAEELPRWTSARTADRYTVVPDIDLLEEMLHSPMVGGLGEIERVVIDGQIDLDRFMLLTATLPDRFNGELLFIRPDGSGYLSTRELKSVRSVKAISEMEVEVYLRWHGLPARSRSSYSSDDSDH